MPDRFAEHATLRLVLGVTLAALVIHARPSRAQHEPRIIEEIVVTAQKKEQSLEEVPISLSVLDGEFLKEASVTDFRDLSLYVPNVSVNNNSNQFNDVRIRGFGSPLSNAPFEQSVGLVIDGIPYSGRSYWQGPIFDLERVEVLRGPQGTLFGKNTTAGLFNLVTKKPSDELQASLTGELGELDHRRFEGGIGGPLVADFLNFRISGLSDERDGYVANTTARVAPQANERMAGRARKAVRAQLGLPARFAANLVVGYEHVEIEGTGSPWELATVVDQQVPFFREYDPGVDLKRGNFIGSIEQPEHREVGMDTVVANGRYDWAGWGFDVLAGHSVVDLLDRNENDFTPAPILWNFFGQDSQQTVAELRASPPSWNGLLGLEQLAGFPLGRSELTAGVFFQDQDIDVSNDVVFNFPILAQFLATDATGVVPPCPECAGGAGLDHLNVRFRQGADSVAGFSHFTWFLADRWTIEYGMRFTFERKTADWQTTLLEGAGIGSRALLGFEEFTADRDRSESGFTPKLSIRFDWTDDASLYASWGKGFKSGGFNATVFNDDVEEGLSFDPERTTSWEIGAKTKLLNGLTTLNLGLYQQTVTDLQVFTVDPNRNFLVENAGEARSRGIEIDSTWLPTGWLTLRGALGLNDTRYVEFPYGACAFDRPNRDGDSDNRCDLTGEPFEFTPKWTSTVTGAVSVPLSSIQGFAGAAPSALSALDLLGGLIVEYRDVHFATQSLDPRSRQPSFVRLHASLGFGNTAQGWSLRLNAKNLTNQATAVHVRDVSVVGKSFAQALEPPRLLFGELRWTF